MQIQVHSRLFISRKECGARERMPAIPGRVGWLVPEGQFLLCLMNKKVSVATSEGDRPHAGRQGTAARPEPGPGRATCPTQRFSIVRKHQHPLGRLTGPQMAGPPQSF